MLGEGHGYRRDHTGLNHGEYGPTVDKTHAFAIDAGDKIVLTPCIGHHCSELTKTEGRHEGNYAGKDPGQQNQRPVSELSGHIAGNQENTTSYHTARNQQYRIK